MFQTLTNLAES